MSELSLFKCIKNFFNESNRGVWGKPEILLALDTLFHEYQNESTKKPQEEITQSVKDSRGKEVKP